MKINILVPDVSSPTVGAAVALCGYLSARHDLDIVGPNMGPGVCGMYRTAAPFRTVFCPRLYRLPDYLWQSRRLDPLLDGDLIVSVKAYANTLPVALRVKKKRGCPVMVYLDEWDGAVYYQQTRRQRVAGWLANWHHPMSEIYTSLVEKMIPFADAVLSTTRFLQSRFGGQVIRMGVDSGRFCPQPAERVTRLRSELGLEEYRIIVFGGVARPHKGIELLLEAIRRVRGHEVRLVVAGPRTPWLERLMKTPEYRDLLYCVGDALAADSVMNQQVHDRLPEYLDLADIIVLPQMDTLLARSQMPIKVFEAMAMAKPIIASNVSDLPLVLEGCGRIVPPGDLVALAEAIEYVLNHPEESAAMGMAARRRCVNLYSREQTEKELLEIIRKHDAPPGKSLSSRRDDKAEAVQVLG